MAQAVKLATCMKTMVLSREELRRLEPSGMIWGGLDDAC